jgi:glycosyltransferase involved in cell wall biosynthesis
LRLELHGPVFWRGMLETAAWGIAFVWITKAYATVSMLPTVTNLIGVDWDIGTLGEPTLTVVVPAKDEAQNIAATLDALLVADYPWLRIVVVDDRSTDGTAAIVDDYCAAHMARIADAKTIRPGILKQPPLPHMDVIHITELPEGWLGKTYALAVATERSTSDYILYTDADVLFSPSVLRRAMAFAEASEADHLVVLPTMQVKSRGEGIVLGFFQIMGLWASRLWRVEDPQAHRDVIGVGAFNLVRRSALEEIGGWLPQRLAVVEDVTLGRRMKAAGMRQRIAFAPGLVLVHWAKGARGLLRGMTKNFFSSFGFQPLLVVMACLWILIFCLLPIAGLGWYRTFVPAILTLVCIAAMYRSMGEISWIDARYAWLYPLGALGLLFAMLRSMLVVLWQGGVTWRGTTYPLRDLRRHNSPFVWESEARKVREEQIRAARMVRRAKKTDR